jgi:hypothetical protein
VRRAVGTRGETADGDQDAEEQPPQSCGEVLVVSVAGGLAVSVSGAGGVEGSGGGWVLRVAVSGGVAGEVG